MIRNATYFGEFKTLAYSLGLEYVSFWAENRVFTDAQVLRMDEAELTSDLLVALLDGIKSRKAIDAYYKKYDDDLKNKIPGTFLMTLKPHHAPPKTYLQFYTETLRSMAEAIIPS